MALAKLTIDLEARLAGLQAGLDKAGKLAEQRAAQINSAWTGLKSVAAGVGAAFAGALSAGAFTRFLRDTSQSVDALNDMSDATGSTVENLSALEDIAARTGTEFAVVGDAIVKLNKALGDSKPGNEIDQALKAIGLSAADLKKLDPSEALLKIAQNLSGFADDGNKARLVQELFGKSLKEVAPLLKDLAESGRLNATVTKEQAEQAEKFNKQLAAFDKNATDAGRAIVGKMLPALNEILRVFNEKGLLKALDEFGNQAFNWEENQMLKPLRAARAELAAINLELQLAAKQPKGVGANRTDRLLELTQQQAAAQEKVNAAAAAFYKIQPGTGAGGGRGSVNPAVVAPPPRGLPDIVGKDKLKEVAAEVNHVDRAFAALIEGTDTVKFAILGEQFEALRKAAEAGLDPKIVEQVRAMLTPTMGPNDGPPISEELARLQALLRQTDSGQLVEMARDAQLLRDALNDAPAGTQRWLQLTDALMDVEERIDALALKGGKLPEGLSRAQQLGQDFGETIGNAFESAVLQGEKFSDVLKGLAQDLIQLFIRRQILDKLVTGSGAWFTGLLAANGHAFGSQGVIPFANGGVVTAPTMFGFGNGRAGLMGEADAEGILPLRRGSDGKLGVIAQGGGPQIVQYLTVQSGVSRGEMMAALEISKRQAMGEMADLRRRGRSDA